MARGQADGLLAVILPYALVEVELLASAAAAPPLPAEASSLRRRRRPMRRTMAAAAGWMACGVEAKPPVVLHLPCLLPHVELRLLQSWGPAALHLSHQLHGSSQAREQE